jgi:hypothetical protein
LGSDVQIIEKQIECLSRLLLYVLRKQRREMSESEFKDIEGIEWPSEKKDSFYKVL